MASGATVQVKVQDLPQLVEALTTFRAQVDALRDAALAMATLAGKHSDLWTAEDRESYRAAAETILVFGADGGSTPDG